MSRSYTQTVVPVSRVPERFFGWTAWILLLLLAIAVLVFSLTTARSETFENNTADYIANVIVELDRMGPDTESGDVGSLSLRETFNLFTTVDGLDSYQTTLEGQDPAIQDFAIAIINWIIDFFNQLWVVALLLFFPLFVGIFGLLTIRNRIVSGLLLTLTAIMTAPLIALLLIPGIIPMFFIVAAILLFVRKNKVITHEDAEINTVEGERKEKRRSRRQEKKEEAAREQAAERQDDTKFEDEEPTKRRRRKVMQATPKHVAEEEETIIDQSNLEEDDDIVVAEPKRSGLTRAAEDRNLQTDSEYDYIDEESNDNNHDDFYNDDEDLDRTRQFDVRDLEQEDDIDQTRQFRKIEEEEVETYDDDSFKRRRRRREDEL